MGLTSEERTTAKSLYGESQLPKTVIKKELMKSCQIVSFKWDLKKEKKKSWSIYESLKRCYLRTNFKAQNYLLYSTLLSVQCRICVCWNRGSALQSETEQMLII